MLAGENPSEMQVVESGVTNILHEVFIRYVIINLKGYRLRRVCLRYICVKNSQVTMQHIS